MSLPAGTVIGPYHVTSLLGAGGMGEVYRARDARLHRDVALKMLPADLARDSERLARLKQEAQVLAGLSHPGIAAIYGVEETSEVLALVLELVEGPTLADRIRRGAIPVVEALAIAHQIAEALEAAHNSGVIHRDLKPANVKVRPDGMVKVLDFGLAKAVESPEDASVHAAMAPTVSSPAMTARGAILGTAAYMSPEQAKGRQADRRSDVWALGVVLYEMLAGHRPFRGDDVAETLAAVLRAEPAWDELPAGTPTALHRLLRRCLQKDVRRRWQHIGDVRLELGELDVGGQEGSVAPVPRRLRPLALAVLAVAAVGGVLGAWALRRPPLPQSPPTRLTIDFPTSLRLTPQTVSRDVAVAPNGSFLVYRGGRDAQLVLRRFDQLDAVPLAGVTNARELFVSPDSRWIGFVENNTTLRKLAVGGGSPITLATLPGSPRGASWIDNSTIVIATNATGLLRVPADGGAPVELTTPDRARGELGHMHPSPLPGGRAVLFTIAADDPQGSQVAVLNLETRQRTMLLRGGTDARYLTSGHLLYADDDALLVVRFDLAHLAVDGNPVTVVTRVSVSRNGTANAALTETGTLVYLPQADDLLTRSLAWVDRRGRETPVPVPPGAYSTVRLSPDGTRVAIETRSRRTKASMWDSNISVWDLVRQAPTTLTFNGGMAPVWMPDGLRIVFAGPGALTQPNLFMRAADGTGTILALTESKNIQAPTSIAPDGTTVVGVERRPRTGSDLVRVALQGDSATARAAQGLVETTSTEQNGEVAPDGRFLAYESNASGRFEVYVQPFPQLDGGLWQVSTAGGTRPAWARKGRELVYLDGDNRLTVVPIEIIGSTFRAGTPTTVSTTTYPPSVDWRTYDISPDGERFLVLKSAGPTEIAPPSLVVVSNWLEELRTKLASAR